MKRRHLIAAAAAAACLPLAGLASQQPALGRWDFVVRYRMTPFTADGPTMQVEGRYLNGQVTEFIDGQPLADAQTLVDPRGHTAMQMGHAATMDSLPLYAGALSTLLPAFEGYLIGPVEIYTQASAGRALTHIGGAELNPRFRLRNWG